MNRRGFLKLLTLGLLLFFQKRLGTTEKLNNTLIMIDPIFLKHHIAPNHPETPKRIEYINAAIKNSGFKNITANINFKGDISEWIKKIHTAEHIKEIAKKSPIAHSVAKAGVKACINAIDKVANRQNKNIFCATRPPGHHALNSGQEEGFCYYNNVAIAAKYAQEKYKLKKVLIIDWDYHHGNGTEAAFYDDSSVLFFSTHDQFAYPGTGSPSKKGKGTGKGYNINVHLPCGTSDKMIIEKFKKILVPEAKKFKPDLILISAGFDSKKNDLLGCFDITDSGFIELTKIVMEIAHKFCEDKIVSILEGGYNLEGNAKAVIAHVSALNGKI
ncbi:MAG: histone deacetylase [Rickettsiales bacterium]|nr:histone deacetylase [Rickettsiales bacterium]